MDSIYFLFRASAYHDCMALLSPLASPFLDRFWGVPWITPYPLYCVVVLQKETFLLPSSSSDLQELSSPNSPCRCNGITQTDGGNPC